MGFKASPRVPLAGVSQFEELGPQALQKLGKKLDGIRDGRALLADSADDHFGLLWHLIDHRLILERPASSWLIEVVCDGIELLELRRNTWRTGTPPKPDHLFATLRRIPDDECDHSADLAGFTPNMSAEVDVVVSAAYRADPDRARALRDEVGPNVRAAIDFVRGCFGEAIPPTTSALILRHLAETLCQGRYLRDEVYVAVDGELSLEKLDRTDALRRLAMRFGSGEEWARALAACIVKHAESFGARGDDMLEALDGLCALELQPLLELFYANDALRGLGSLLQVLQARHDPAAELFGWAKRLALAERDAIHKKLRDESERRRLAAALAVAGIRRASSEGVAVPPFVDSLFSEDMLEDTSSIEALRAALAALEPARCHAIVRQLHGASPPAAVIAVADVHFDRKRVEQTIDAISDSYGSVDPLYAKFCGLEAASLLAERGYPKAALASLLHAWTSDGSWPERYDAIVDLGGRVETEVQAALGDLPLSRVEAMLRANLRAHTHQPFFLLGYLREDVSDAVIDEIFAAVVRCHDTAQTCPFPYYEMSEEFIARLVPHWEEALRGQRVGQAFLRELEGFLGEDAFTELERRLGQLRESDAEVLARAIARSRAPAVRIYRLTCEHGESSGDDLSRWGGPAPGISARAKGRLSHLFTLDLAHLPELARRYPGARALSLLVPEDGDDFSESKLIPTKSELTPIDTGDAGHLRVEPLEVPVEVFDDFEDEADGETKRDLTRIFAMVRAGHGYLLGGPLWLQSGQAGADPEFLGQLWSMEGLLLGDGELFMFFDGECVAQYA